MTGFWIFVTIILIHQVFLCQAVAPVLSGLPTSISVGELETVNRLIYTITATDPDNDAFVCDVASTDPANGPFVGIKDADTNKYGIYTDNPTFSYAMRTVHTVTIQCTDTGGLMGTGVLSVDVIEGDALTFDNLPASTTHDASTTLNGASIYTVSTTDAKGHTTMTYTMTSSPSTTSFTIDTGTGAVTADRDLKYEIYTSIKLYITVSDGSIAAVQVLTVVLTNINTAPTITNLVLNSVTSVSFFETSALRTLIYTLNVYDPDSGQTQYVTFDTTPATEAALFNLTNNAISLTHPNRFNYEDQITYMLDIYVTDSIQTTGPYYLQITVLNEGERCNFDKTLYEATVDEGGVGSRAINLGFSITDPDNPDSHTYTIRNGDDAHLFAIDSTTGIITFAVDYDVDSGSNHPQNASILIQCTDTYSLTGTATVSIYVNDVNDNAPDFNAGGYVVEVNQYHNPGAIIGTLNASDKDSGNNGEVEYTGTSSTGVSYYQIAKNGQIILLTTLTFEYGTTHRFHVTAVDHGSPQLTGTTYVDIVYRYVTTTTPTTTTTTLAPTDFWTVENIALIASLGALALLGLAALLFMLLRNTGCCSGVNGPSSCRQICKCPKKSPNRVVVTPKNPKASEWKLWDNNELNIQRKPFVTNVTETAIPQTMKM